MAAGKNRRKGQATSPRPFGLLSASRREELTEGLEELSAPLDEGRPMTPDLPNP